MTKRRPRVFHLITRLLKGGAEAKTIATVLGLDDYEFTVGYGASYDQEQVERLEANGVETERFPLIRHYNPVSSLPAVAVLARYLRQNDFDIVHTHSTEAGIIGRFAAAAAGVPHVVHTVHGVPFADDRNVALNWFVLGCERWAAKYTDRIITNADVIASNYLAKDIGRPDQYTTVYSGIDIGTFHDASPADGMRGDGTKVLMVGRLADGKGFDDLLTAVDRINDAELSVYLVGDGPLRDHLAFRIERLGLGDTVSLLGYRDDVPSIMAACDIFVLPSYREGTPRVITEAMASGLPVIATDIAGVPEQVEYGTNGFLIEPGDIGELAEQIERLCSSSELRDQLGSAGRELVETFSTERMLSELDSVYEGLLSG